MACLPRPLDALPALMSSTPSQQVVDPVDNDDPYTPFSDYAESRSSRNSASSALVADHVNPSSHGYDGASDPQFSVKDLGVKAVDGHTSVHARPFSYNPSRQLPAVDAKHRPAYSLDSSRPTPPTRETSWYLEDLEEEAPAATSGSVLSTNLLLPRQYTNYRRLAPRQ